MDTDPEEQERRERFGRELRAALEESPLRKQKDLADHLGIDQTMISAWMHGKKLGAMTRSRVEKIERHLACTPGTLISALFGPAPIHELAPQIEERLAAIEKRAEAVEATTARMAALMEEIAEVIRESDRRLGGRDTS